MQENFKLSTHLWWRSIVLWTQLTVGRYIAVGSEDGRLRLFNDRWECLYTCRYVGGRITAITFMQGQFLYVCNFPVSNQKLQMIKRGMDSTKPSRWCSCVTKMEICILLTSNSRHETHRCCRKWRCTGWWHALDLILWKLREFKCFVSNYCFTTVRWNFSFTCTKTITFFTLFVFLPCYDKMYVINFFTTQLNIENI